MGKTKIELVTLSDVTEFVNIVSKLKGKVRLRGIDGENEVVVNAKSIIGALYTMQWSELWCEADDDIYIHIAKWAR